MDKERPIDFFFDFINVVVALGIVAFFFIYFIVGDRVGQAEQIVRAILPFSGYAVIYVLKWRMSMRELKGFKEQDTVNELVFYITKKDLRKDLIIICTLPLVMLSFNWLDGYIDVVDYFQVGAVFLIMLGWHYIKLRARAKDVSAPGFRRGDIIRDEIMIFSLPFWVLFLPLLFLNANIIDLAQAIAPLAIMFVWRKILYSNR